MLRGEIWTYRPVLERPGQSLLRIILSADGFNRDESRVQVTGRTSSIATPVGC